MHSDLRGSVVDKNRKNLDSSEREILDSIKTENCTQAVCGVLCLCERGMEGGREGVMRSLILMNSFLDLLSEVVAFI